jgi:hypothetical protein
MRVVPFAILLSLCAGAAQAETWRVLHWDRFGLIAVDAQHGRTTGSSDPALPVLELKLYPGAPRVEANIREEEFDCAGRRLRTRTWSQYFGDIQTAAVKEIEPWRGLGEDSDRLVARAVCDPHGLDKVPSVTASLQEVVRAHLNAARTPKALAATPVWSAAWSALAPGRGPDALRSIANAVRNPHPFVVASITTDRRAVLLATDFEKIGDDRYRFQVARVGPYPKVDGVAVWLLQEADCSGLRLRTLAWTSFDAQARKKSGEDTNTIGTAFEPPTPDTTEVTVLKDVCGASRIIPKMRVVTSDLAGAIAAHRWILQGDATAAKGLRDAAGWRAAYAACGCAPANDRRPTGSPNREMTKSSDHEETAMLRYSG